MPEDFKGMKIGTLFNLFNVLDDRKNYSQIHTETGITFAYVRQLLIFLEQKKMIISRRQGRCVYFYMTPEGKEVKHLFHKLEGVLK